MALIDPICMPFVLQTGPFPAMIDPESGQKILQNRKFCSKSAGQAQKRALNALFSMVSLSHAMGGTKVGQHWDKRCSGTVRRLIGNATTLSASEKICYNVAVKRADGEI